MFWLSRCTLTQGGLILRTRYVNMNAYVHMNSDGIDYRDDFILLE